MQQEIHAKGITCEQISDEIVDIKNRISHEEKLNDSNRERIIEIERNISSQFFKETAHAESNENHFNDTPLFTCENSQFRNSNKQNDNTYDPQHPRNRDVTTKKKL